MKYLIWILAVLLAVFLLFIGLYINDSSNGEDIYIPLKEDIITIREDIIEDIEENKNNGLSDNKSTTNSSIRAVTNNETQETHTDDDTPSELNEDFSLNVVTNPYATFISRNQDYVGWINIDGTPIDYPVVKGSDNDYYLNHNFDNKSDERGAIFMDYRNFGQGLDNHTIIYGHTMRNGTMFGSLENYMKEDYIEEHPIIELTDLYTERRYKIISVYYAKADPELLDRQPSNGMDSYLEDLRTRSMVDIDNIDTGSTQLLTLVTCSYEVNDGRYFIHALEVTDDETDI